MKWQITLALTALFWLSNRSQAETTITFDELPFQSVHGLTLSGVQYSFHINGSPSDDAFFASFGPGSLTYVTDPSLTGRSTGVLTLTFAVPTRVLEFGAALNTANPLSPGLTVALFDSSTHSLGTTSVNTITAAGGLGFSEGHFAYSGAPISQAVIDFADSPGSFAIDNLVYEIPEPATMILTLVIAAGLWRARPQAFSQRKPSRSSGSRY